MTSSPGERWMHIIALPRDFRQDARAMVSNLANAALHLSLKPPLAHRIRTANSRQNLQPSARSPPHSLSVKLFDVIRLLYRNC